MVAVTLDEKYRITIPKEARGELKPGDVLFVVREQSAQGDILHVGRAINPFDALAEAAIAEDERGETRSLREVAAELGVALPDAE